MPCLPAGRPCGKEKKKPKRGNYSQSAWVLGGISPLGQDLLDRREVMHMMVKVVSDCLMVFRQIQSQ